MNRRLFSVMMCAGLLGAGVGFADETERPFEEEAPVEVNIMSDLPDSPPGPSHTSPSDTMNDRADPPPGRSQTNTLGDWFRLGALVLLGVLAALGIAAIVERVLNLRLARVVPDQLPGRALDLWKNKKYAELSTLCGKDGSILARVIGTLLEHRGTEDVTLVKMLVEDKAKRELRLESRRTGTLLIIATIAPLLGLCGTFAGFFGAFMNVDSELKGVLVVEIAKALSTTVAGLVVAMPMLLFYQIFRSRANFFAILLEEEVSKLVNIWFVRKT